MTKKCVFLSHAAESSQIAGLIADRLQGQGLPVWLASRDLEIGASIATNVRAALQDAHSCLLLLDQHSLVSSWCHAETGAFLGAGKHVVVFRADRSCPLPDYLSDLLIADDLAAAISALVEHSLEPEIDTALNTQRLAREGFTAAFRIPSENPARLQRVMDLIEAELGSNRSLRLAATSGYSYLHPAGPVWTAGLGRLLTGKQLELKVVLESPFSQYALTRASANQLPYHHWQDRTAPEPLIHLLQYPNLEIRVTRETVTASVFLTSDSAVLDPYLLALPHDGARTENNFWVFEFSRGQAPAPDSYAILAGHFDFLFTRSVPIEEVLHEPDEGQPLPLGPKFLQLWRDQPDYALNRYKRRSEEFRELVSQRETSLPPAS